MKNYFVLFLDNALSSGIISDCSQTVLMYLKQFKKERLRDLKLFHSIFFKTWNILNKKKCIDHSNIQIHIYIEKHKFMLLYVFFQNKHIIFKHIEINQMLD